MSLCSEPCASLYRYPLPRISLRRSTPARLCLRTTQLETQSRLNKQFQLSVFKCQCVQLNDGTRVPLLGYGTFERQDPAASVKMASTEAGMRHIDCAERYGNAEAAGRGLKDLQLDERKRDDIFVTTKCKWSIMSIWYCR